METKSCRQSRQKPRRSRWSTSIFGYRINIYPQYMYLFRTTFALINLMKGMVGPGCFALPMAFRQAGLWVSLSGWFLVRTRKVLCGFRPRSGSIFCLALYQLFVWSSWLKVLNTYAIGELNSGKCSEFVVTKGLGSQEQLRPTGLRKTGTRGICH